MFRRSALIALTTAMLVAGSGATALAGPYDYLLAPSSACPHQSNRSLSAAQQEKVMLCMHNYARRKVGRAPLAASSLLQTSADHKTGDLLRCGFSHTACGRPFDYWFRRVGYLSCPTYRIGENIAWGSGYLGTVRQIMDAWLNSDGHRENLLSSGYREVGFGLRVGTMDGYGGAAVWTAEFGYRRC